MNECTPSATSVAQRPMWPDTGTLWQGRVNGGWMKCQVIPTPFPTIPGDKPVTRVLWEDGREENVTVGQFWSDFKRASLVDPRKSESWRSTMSALVFECLQRGERLNVQTLARCAFAADVIHGTVTLAGDTTNTGDGNTEKE
jgi:hypothetical protein